MGNNKSLPWFQFNAVDFLSSLDVLEMDMADRGVYITFLCHQWVAGWLPTDYQLLARQTQVDRRMVARWMPAWNHLFATRSPDGSQMANERLSKCHPLFKLEKSPAVEEKRKEEKRVNETIPDGIGLATEQGQSAMSVKREPGTYEKDAFKLLKKDPEKIFDELVDAWQKEVPGGTCNQPFRGWWDGWKRRCRTIDADVLIPAFELWAADNADSRETDPVVKFMKVEQTWIGYVNKPETRPAHLRKGVLTPEQKIKKDAAESAADATFIARRREAEVNRVATDEPGPEAL